MANKHEQMSEMNQVEIIKPIIIDDQVIEPVLNLEMANIAEEKFMNEMVEVVLNSTSNENDAPHVTFNVNGRNQTFFRDIPVKCRRMFVEVMARCKETKYKQQIDPLDLTRYEMKATTSFAYPFNVTEDPNPKGNAWLRAVKAEAA